ncbi:MAG TPA: TIM barrel protein [Chloroflexota bacterium]|nr:TIM barrel protein [Chloroflexota bacterium]
MRLAIGSGPAFREGVSPAILRWWKKQGVEGIVFYDVWPADFYRTPLDHFRETKKVLDDVGLAVAGFNALRKSLFMPELAEIDQRRTEHCLEVCRVLRPAIFDISVNVPIPHGLDPMAMAARPIFRGAYASAEAYREAAARLKIVARTCAELGADLSIELHDDGLQDTADGCLRLVELIDEPNVGVNPDVGNWYRVPYEHPETWRDQIRKLAPRTNYWEVKNYKRILVPPDHRGYSWNVDLDEGDLDFREMAVTLWRAGFRGWVCHEGGQGDIVRTTVKYLQYMRWILDEWIPLVT